MEYFYTRISEHSSGRSVKRSRILYVPSYDQWIEPPSVRIQIQRNLLICLCIHHISLYRHRTKLCRIVRNRAQCMYDSAVSKLRPLNVSITMRLYRL